MRTLISTFAALSVGIFACGGAKPVPPSPAVAHPLHAMPPVGSSAPTGRALTRSTVHAAVAQGLGALLQYVELDDKPALVAGKFHGFRIGALRDTAFWNGVDLKPGDVVTLVNGLPIERPEQAQRALESLDGASELRVSYERDGEPRELVYPIIDDR